MKTLLPEGLRVHRVLMVTGITAVAGVGILLGVWQTGATERVPTSTLATSRKSVETVAALDAAVRLAPSETLATAFLPLAIRNGHVTYGRHLIEGDTLREPGVRWQAVAVVGDIGYAGRVLPDGRAQLAALALRADGHLDLVGSPIPLPDVPLRIGQSGGLLVVTMNRATLVIDASDPGHLQRSSQLAANGALGVAMRGRFAFVRDAGRNMVTCSELQGYARENPTEAPFPGIEPASWLRIMDLTSLAQPHIVGELAIRLPHAPCLTDIAVNDNYAFLAAQSGGLVAVDLRDLTAPRMVATTPRNAAVAAVAIDVGTPTWLWTDDGIPGDLPVAELAVSLWDALDPLALRRVGQLRLQPTSEAAPKLVRLVSTTAGLVIVDPGHLWWLDTSDPHMPRQIDAWQLGPEEVRDMAANERHVLVARGGDGVTTWTLGPASR